MFGRLLRICSGPSSLTPKVTFKRLNWFMAHMKIVLNFCNITLGINLLEIWKKVSFNSIRKSIKCLWAVFFFQCSTKINQVHFFPWMGKRERKFKIKNKVVIIMSLFRNTSLPVVFSMLPLAPSEIVIASCNRV